MTDRSTTGSVTGMIRNRVPIAIAAASVGWGLAGVGTRAAYGAGANTSTVVVIRTLVATAAVVAFAVARRHRLERRTWRDGLIIGIPRIGIAPMLFMASLQYISAGVESLIITLIPATTAGIAAVTIGERLRRRQLVGLAVGLAGTALIIAAGESGIAEGGDVVRGGLLALGGVAAGSTSGVLSRRFAPHHGTAKLALPMFVGGAAVVSGFGLATSSVRTASLGPSTWFLLIALGIGSTLLPFVSTLYASRHATAATVALTGYLAPVIGVVGGVALLGEHLSIPIVVGGAMTIAGVFLAGRSPTRRVATPTGP